MKEQEQGEKDARGRPHTSRGVRVKVRYTEVRKGKHSEAEGRWDSLRKAARNKPS